MADYLVIRLGERAGDSVEWIAVGDDGTRRGPRSTGTLAEAALEIHDRPVIVLVPGAEVLTTFTSIPAKGARLQAVLPYALEDQLADDVDNLHFAPGKRDAGGRLPVAVVARPQMQAWLEALAAAGIRAARIVPENHGLARIPNTLAMLVTEDRVMFNDGAEMEFVIPGLAPADALATTGILEASADDAGSTPRHLLVYCDAALGDRYERDWALLRHELEGVDVNLLPDGAFPRLAVTVVAGAGINLLQGTFGDKAGLGTSLRPWRFAALLLAALVFSGVAAKGVDLYRLSAERTELKAQFTAEYRRLRPNDEREIADPVGTISSLRRSQGATAAGPQVFLPSLNSLASAVAENGAVRVEAVSYRAGVIDVRLNAPDIPTLDKVVQAIDASGQFVASLQSADTVGDRVNSRIQIREAGS
jgi:general secretion pathway protein L